MRKNLVDFLTKKMGTISKEIKIQDSWKTLPDIGAQGLLQSNQWMRREEKTVAQRRTGGTARMEQSMP